MILVQFILNESLVFVSERPNERFAHKKQAICSKLLFWYEQPERFARSHSFVLYGLYFKHFFLNCSDVTLRYQLSFSVHYSLKGMQGFRRFRARFRGGSALSGTVRNTFWSFQKSVQILKTSYNYLKAFSGNHHNLLQYSYLTQSSWTVAIIMIKNNHPHSRQKSCALPNILINNNYHNKRRPSSWSTIMMSINRHKWLAAIIIFHL